MVVLLVTIIYLISQSIDLKSLELRITTFKSIIYLIIKLVLFKFVYDFINLLYTRIRLRIDYEYTKHIYQVHFQNDLCIVGGKGFGKDSLASNMVQIYKEELSNIVSDKLADLERLLYHIDFERLNNYLDNNIEKYIGVMGDTLKKQLLSEIKYEFLRNGYDIEIENTFIDTKVRKISIADLLTEYVFLYYRKNHIKNYIMSNQPYLENKELGALKLSYNYFKIKEYEEFILIPYLVLLDTEAGLFYNSSDTETNKKNKTENGMFELFAVLRHLLIKYRYITTIQEEGRNEKWHREFFTNVVYIKRPSVIIEDYWKSRWVIKQLINLLILNSNIVKYIKSLKIVTLMRSKISVHKINNKDHKNNIRNRNMVFSIITGLNRYLIFFLTLQYIKLLSYGYIEQDIYVTYQYAFQKKEYELTRKDLYESDYIDGNFHTSIRFPVLSSWPFYNTTYMEGVGNSKRDQASITINDAIQWSMDLSFNKEDALHINHKLFNEMFEKKEIKTF